MAKSKVTITILSIPSVNDSFILGNSATVATQDVVETFDFNRDGLNKVEIKTTNIFNASSLLNSLQLDYNNTGLYIFELLNNTVTITSTLSDVEFNLISLTGTSFTVDIENLTETADIEIVSVVFSADDVNPSTKVKVTVLTSVLSEYVVIEGVSQAQVNLDNPFEYTLNRGVSNNLTVLNFTEFPLLTPTTATQLITTPDVLNVNNLSISIISNPEYYEANVSVLKTNLLNLQYSLDNLNWQYNKVFMGIAVGSYTVYVKDQFGITISKSFLVNELVNSYEVKDSYCYISKAMSIRYKKNEVWDYVDIHKNQDNTLSCEENNCMAYQFYHKFKTADFVKTQLLSNYENIEVNVVKSDGSKDSVTIENKIKFLDLKDSRDAIAYTVSETKTGIYFNSGNTYDYDLGSINGSYALNGKLPEYAGLNSYIKIENEGWYLIEDIIHSENKNADVLVINRSHNIADQDIVVSNRYNQQNFNVYEFLVDFSQYNNSQIQVEILQSSSIIGFTDCNYLSEVIEVKDCFENSVEIKWRNDADTLLFYSTGIYNIGNFDFLKFNFVPDGSIDIFKTPSTSVVIEASNYEAYELVIEDVTSAIVHQLVQVALHKNIRINNIDCVSNEKPEISNIDGTNLYTITFALSRVRPSNIYWSSFAAE